MGGVEADGDDCGGGEGVDCRVEGEGGEVWGCQWGVYADGGVVGWGVGVGVGGCESCMSVLDISSPTRFRIISLGRSRKTACFVSLGLKAVLLCMWEVRKDN